MNTKLLLLTAVFSVLAVSVGLAKGETSITTYYPSPTGYYNKFSVKNSLMLMENSVFACDPDPAKFSLGIKDGRLISCKGTSPKTPYFPVAVASGAYGGSWQIYPEVPGGTISGYYLNLNPETPAMMNGLGNDSEGLKLFTENQLRMTINKAGLVGIRKKPVTGKALAVEGEVEITGGISIGPSGNPTATINSAGDLEVETSTVNGLSTVHGDSVVDLSSTVGSLIVPGVAGIDAAGISTVTGSIVNGNAKIRDNVGIGIAATVASEKLEVNGNIVSTGNITSLSPGVVKGGGGIQLPVTNTPTCGNQNGCMWITP